ncbi:MAG: hypothetical protein AMJ92_11525, partial [candidate division Zixibacteria bacterium SM23_81]
LARRIRVPREAVGQFSIDNAYFIIYNGFSILGIGAEKLSCWVKISSIYPYGRKHTDAVLV